MRSQISLGSNDMAASIVMTTTAQKKTAPASALMLARLPNRTRATRMVTT